jgi:hypothetical protein
MANTRSGVGPGGHKLVKFAVFFHERKFALMAIDLASPLAGDEMTKSLGFFPFVQICTNGKRRTSGRSNSPCFAVIANLQ